DANITVQEVKAQTILLRVDLIQEPGTQKDPLLLSHPAFENGLLDPLAIILARLRHPSQPLRSLRDCGSHIVSNQDQHVAFIPLAKWPKELRTVILSAHREH